MLRRPFTLLFVLLLLCLFCIRHLMPVGVSAETPTATDHRSTDNISTIHLAEADGYLASAGRTRFSSDPTNPFATLRTFGVATAEPNAVAQFRVTIRNFEAITRTISVTTALPAQLIYVDPCAENTEDDPCISNSAFQYAADTKTLSWAGQVSPAHLDYNIELAEQSIPYLDLADYGAVNLCDEFLSDDQRCDAATVTFNLGVNGYAATLYGKRQHALTVSADGTIMGANFDNTSLSSLQTENVWLPHSEASSLKLAGLWRNNDLTDFGRWHVAILDGLIEGHPVFYAQWHDAPHAADSNLTVRHAIAVVLDGSGGLDGHVYYLYDNVSDPAATVHHGYTIGITDSLGERGQTYAFGADPSAASNRPPQGYPPQGRMSLHLYPILAHPENAAGKILTYTAQINAAVPETIATTTVALSDSAHPDLAYTWSTHYLSVRWHTYLPVLR